jgi:glycosyltransferase involved in cell wall biosynthesis
LRPLKILDLRDTHETGGPGKTILETYRAIDHERFHVHLGMFRAHDDRSDTPFLQAASAIGLPVHEIRVNGPYDPRQVSRLAALIKEQEFDIVHPHEASSDVIAYVASKLRRVPLVTTAHGWIGNSSKQRAIVAVDKFAMRGFDLVIAVSNKIRQDLIDAGVRPERIRLLHNAIVLDNYRRNGHEGLLKSMIGAPARPVLVSIGRLSPEKGHADLVEALRLVSARGRQVSAVLAGDGPSRADIERRVRDAGLSASIHLPGYVKEPARLLQDADLMVLPSHTEGLPNAALESLAMEVPVLATAVGGTPEVVVDGQTGKLVPPRSPELLADAIVDFLDRPDLWRLWARQGKRMVEEQFDFRNRTRKLEAIYVELAAR